MAFPAPPAGYAGSPPALGPVVPALAQLPQCAVREIGNGDNGRQGTKFADRVNSKVRPLASSPASWRENVAPTWPASARRTVLLSSSPSTAPLPKTAAPRISDVRACETPPSARETHGLKVQWCRVVTTTLLQRMCGRLVPSLNDYRGHELIGFYVFAITLAYIAVVMRFVSQKISGARIGLDDYLLLVALVRYVPGRRAGCFPSGFLRTERQSA